MSRYAVCDRCGTKQAVRRGAEPNGWKVIGKKVNALDACSAECARLLSRRIKLDDGRTLFLKDHALSRFVQRAAYLGHVYPDPIGMIRQLVAQWEPDCGIDDIERTKRLLSNGCVSAEYFKCGVWRFVVTGSVIATIETRNHHN